MIFPCKLFSSVYFTRSSRDAFDCCFKHLTSIDIGAPAESLSREVALFVSSSYTDNNRYLVVASIYPGVFFDDDISPPTAEEQRQTGESLPFRNPHAIQNITLHMIDILTGL